ncbi:hypothetical protein BH24ACT18_BH24ACT18_00850 [soil metagenome]
MRPRTLLFVLISVVPVVVAVAFVAAVVLQRAGFGLVIWALLPFVVSMALIGALCVVLGRAATRRASDGRRSRRDDGV